MLVLQNQFQTDRLVLVCRREYPEVPRDGFQTNLVKGNEIVPLLKSLA